MRPSHQIRLQQGAPPATRSTLRSGTKTRISKDEKICKLKSDLKVSREENERLKKEIERLKKDQLQPGSKPGGGKLTAETLSHDAEQEAKFREAMRAMKKVTVSQEMCIRTLRNKAKERLKYIKECNRQIEQLEQKMTSLESTTKTIKKSKGDAELHAKLRQLQLDYDTLVKRNNDLEEILDEKEAKVEALQKQRNSLLPLQNQSKSKRNGQSSKKGDSDTESAGSGSLQSISTAGDFDLARLKTELAKKSETILKLQMDLEMVRDELYDLKQKKKHGETGTFGGNSHFFAQDPFGIGGGGVMQQASDDWTDAEESESEFGEAPFLDGQFGLDGGSHIEQDPFFKNHEREADFW